MSWSKGERAEDYVTGQLLKNGWTLEARNFRRRGFEIDIIASRPGRLLCIEVKARADSPHFDPSSLITRRQLTRLARGMRHWLQAYAAEDTRNTEFWLCVVPLTSRAFSQVGSDGKRKEAMGSPVRTVVWMRLESAGKDRHEDESSESAVEAGDYFQNTH